MASTEKKTPLSREPMGTRRESFVESHATGLTIVLFGALAFALGLFDAVPPELRPIDLTTSERQLAVVERILKKPKMTLSTAESEAVAEGDDDDAELQLADGEPTDGEPVLALDERDSEDGAAAARPEGTALALVPIEAGGGDDPALTAQLPRASSSSAAASRPLMKRTTASASLRALAEKLGAPGATIANPCVRPLGDGCARTALDPLFQALDDVAAGRAGSHVNIVTLGNSLIASDHVTDVVRARLVERFGDGGRGFLLPERLAPAGRRARTGTSSSEWTVHTFAQKPPERPVFGFTGSSHESKKKGDRVTWSLAGANHARLFYLDAKGASPFRVDVDGVQLARVRGEGTDGDKTLDLEIQDGAKKLSVTAEGPGVVLFGVALTKNAPGVSWDTIGVPASDSTMYLTADEGIFARQLDARDANAVVVMMGGNEIRSLAFKWTTPDDIRRDYGALLDRVRAAAPDAACLAVAPIDAAKATAAGAELTTRKEVQLVVDIEREVAREKGCAFFDLFAAMGGDGSLARFHDAGLIHEDLVHPKGKGGDVLGQLFADALFASYQATPPPADQVAQRRRIVPPRLAGLGFPERPGEPFVVDRALAKLADRLTAFGTPSAGRAAVGVFGDEIVAEEAFTDRVRERLVARYGERGRGLVAFGPRDKALLRSRVTRRTTGTVEMIDGRKVVLGGAFGLSGQTARLSPRAEASVTFCDGCRDASTTRRGTLSLTWLFTPDMGVADVYVNDVAVAVIGAELGARASDVARLDIPVLGERHTVRVLARDDSGPVHVLAVAQELDRAGVVVDAIGLAGTTGMTLQRWREELIAAQLAARDYDLVVTLWGANEAWIADLDHATYRHHFGETVRELMASSPDADCVVVTPPERALSKKTKGRPPSADLVARVQREVAAEHGCAHFAMPRALKTLTPAIDSATWPSERADVDRVADLFADDVLAWIDYLAARRDQRANDARDDAALSTTKGEDERPRDVALADDKKGEPAAAPRGDDASVRAPSSSGAHDEASPATLESVSPPAPTTTNAPDVASEGAR